MWMDVALVILVYCFVFTVLGLSKLLVDRYGYSPRLTRHAIHLFAGPTILLLPCFSSWVYPFTLPLGMTAILALGLAKPSALRKVMVDESGYSSLHALGPLYYTLSILILVPLTWGVKAVGMAAVMIMAWGDGAASTLTARLQRRHRYPFSEKTVEGSLIMFLFGLVGAIAAWAIGVHAGSPPLSLLEGFKLAMAGAAVGTVVEALTVGWAKPFDNLTVPLSSALAMAFLA
ncbi:MAG: hypothetical protein QXF21_06460 [Thermoproteota archaeon]